MSDPNLQARFEQALRRALSGATEAGVPVVNVAAPAVQVDVVPHVTATMPALTEPLEVVDVQRFGGAFEYEVKVERTPEGFIRNARLVPVLFHPFITEGTR